MSCPAFQSGCWFLSGDPSCLTKSAVGVDGDIIRFTVHSLNFSAEINPCLIKLLVGMEHSTAERMNLRLFLRNPSSGNRCFRSTFVISSFCFLMLLTISKILCVYADRDASWGRFSNSDTCNENRQKKPRCILCELSNEQHTVSAEL